MQFVIKILIGVVIATLPTKLLAATFTHLVPEDTVYYVEGSLPDLEMAVGYQATDLLIQVNKAGLSEAGIEERKQHPALSYGYDLAVKLANHLHESYLKDSFQKSLNGRYAFYLDGLFPVIHIDSPSSAEIQAALLADAKQNAMTIRTEQWGGNTISYVAMNSKKDREFGLLELTTVHTGDQLTLTITSDVMPMIRKMKVLGLVSDARNLKESNSRFSKLVENTPADGIHGYLNVVSLGRLISSNPSTTAGVDLNLYFPDVAEDMGFSSHKGVCSQELDELLALVPTMIGRVYVEEDSQGVEIDSSLVIEIQDQALAEHIYGLNGSLRLIENADKNILNVATALNFNDASWKLLGLKNYLESYSGQCPDILSLYREIVREVGFSEIALIASFLEGVNGANIGVSHFKLNENVPLASQLQGYASVSTLNLNILRNLSQMAPEEYQSLIPEPGTSNEVYVPDMPPQLGLVMHATDTELTAMFGTEKESMKIVPEFSSEAGIFALDLDIESLKPLYGQIPKDSANCEDLMHGYYIANRLADNYSLRIAARHDGIEMSNSTSVKLPRYSFSKGLDLGKHEFQYLDSQCQWKTFDVVDITNAGPYSVELAEIEDDCSYVNARMNIDIHQGVALISSTGKYKSDCVAEEKHYTYEFNCVIESRNEDELVCSNPKSNSFYRMLKMDAKASAMHQKKIDQHLKRQELNRIKTEHAEVLSYVKNQAAIQDLDIDQQLAWGKLAQSFDESLAGSLDSINELDDLVANLNESMASSTGLHQVLEIDFMDDCWVEVQSANGTKIVAEIKTAGDSIAIELPVGGQVLLGRSSAVSRFHWQGKRIALQPYTKKGIVRIVLTEKAVKSPLPSVDKSKDTSKTVTQNEQVLSALLYIQDEVRKRWVRPANARNGMEVELRIHLVPTGEVISMEVTHSRDATSAFVNSVQQAVKKVGRFDKLADLDPVLFDANFRTFKIVFRPEDLRL